MNGVWRIVTGPWLLAGIVGSLAVIIGGLRLDDWRFFLVGDEYGFYERARAIAQNNLYAGPHKPGVHNMNFSAVSMYQALFLEIKQSFWWWRFSNIALFLPIAFLVYAWGAILFNARVGLLAACFLCSSFYLHNFFLIGYPNSLAVVLFLLVQTAGALCVVSRRTTWLAAFGLGLLLGVSFYVYLGVIVIATIWPYLVFLVGRSVDWRRSLVWVALVGVTTLLVISPGAFSDEAMKAMYRASIGAPEFQGNKQRFLNVAANFKLYWFNLHSSHFVIGPYLDSVTQVGVALGLLSLLLLRNRSGALVLLVALTLPVIVGATSPYSYPPVTRGIIFLPVGCLIAAVGIDALTTLLRLPRRLAGVIHACLLAGVVYLNVERAQRYFELYQVSADADFLNQIREVVLRCPEPKVILVRYGEGRKPNNALGNLAFFLRVQYGMPVQLVDDSEGAKVPEAHRDVCTFTYMGKPEHT